MIDLDALTNFMSRCELVTTREEWDKLMVEAEAMEDEDQSAAAVEHLALYAPPGVSEEYAGGE